jgi:hypothetical protein
MKQDGKDFQLSLGLKDNFHFQNAQTVAHPAVRPQNCHQGHQIGVVLVFLFCSA